MTTSTINFELLAQTVSGITGQKWLVSEDIDMWCWKAAGVLVMRIGTAAPITIVYDPPGENFGVGVLAGDIWLAKGYDIQTMLQEDSDLLDMLSGRLDPDRYWDVKAAKAKLPVEHKKSFSKLNVFGLFTVQIWI